MGRFLLSTISSAVALWITVSLVSGVHVVPFPGPEPASSILTFVVVALIIGLVNTVLGTVLRIISIPLYIVTFGLWSFVLNALLLWLVKLISDAIGWGLQIDAFWWSAVFGAFVLGIANWIVSLVSRILGFRS